MWKSYHYYFHDEIGNLSCDNIIDTFTVSVEDILYLLQEKF